MFRIYDLTNLLALIAIVAGVATRWGWEYGAITGGILMLLLNQATARLLLRRRG